MNLLLWFFRVFAKTFTDEYSRKKKTILSIPHDPNVIECTGHEKGLGGGVSVDTETKYNTVDSETENTR